MLRNDHHVGGHVGLSPGLRPGTRLAIAMRAFLPRIRALNLRITVPSPPRDEASTRADRAEALVRALVGIDDAVVVATPAGDVGWVHVVATPGASPRQAVRNASSALLAGLGVRLARESVTSVNSAELAVIRDALARSRPAAATTPAPEHSSDRTGHTTGNDDGAAAEVTAPAPSDDAQNGAAPAASANGGYAVNVAYAANGTHPANGGNHNGHGNGRRNGHAQAPANGHLASGAKGAAAIGAGGDHLLAPAVAARFAPVPLAAQATGTRETTGARVEAVDVRRLGGKVCCHVTIAARGRRFAGAGEAAADSAASLLGLVARVTIEAVRANMSNAGGIQFDGVTLADVSERPHVIVALHVWRNGAIQAFAGAAPILDSPEDAAARAALGALRELF